MLFTPAKHETCHGPSERVLWHAHLEVRVGEVDRRPADAILKVNFITVHILLLLSVSLKNVHDHRGGIRKALSSHSPIQILQARSFLPSFQHLEHPERSRSLLSQLRTKPYSLTNTQYQLLYIFPFPVPSFLPLCKLMAVQIQQ